MTLAGLVGVLDGARRRAGLAHAYLSRVAAHLFHPAARGRGWRWRRCRPGPVHASIESTRIYLHLADDWLASRSRRASEAIESCSCWVVSDERRREPSMTVDAVTVHVGSGTRPR